MHELHDRGYLIMEGGRRGQPPTIQLLSEVGDGSPYTLPYTDDEPNYFRVPHQLWTTRLIGRLSGAGLALYLCMLSHHRFEDSADGIWFSKKGFRDLHGLGESTRLKGLNELIQADVLSVQERSIDATGGYDYRTFRRRLFTIEPPYAPPRPAKRPVQTPFFQPDPWASNFEAEPIPAPDNRWPPTSSAEAIF